jgi:hypothetical protein
MNCNDITHRDAHTTGNSHFANSVDRQIDNEDESVCVWCVRVNVWRIYVDPVTVELIFFLNSLVTWFTVQFTYRSYAKTIQAYIK